MCGIAGIATNQPIDLARVVTGMADALSSRGPDDSGIWLDSSGSIALGHRRLSILDLSDRGHQPMLSRSGRYVVVFNGEIFNFVEIRQELTQRGHDFNGCSDTEVLLAATEEWGVVSAVERFNGMFAYAIYDRVDRKLWLVRDRIGEKPLYFGWNRGAFLFSSELKSFWSYPEFSPTISSQAAAGFVAYGYVAAPQSIYEGIWKVRPGHIVAIDFNRLLSRDCGRNVMSYAPVSQDGLTEIRYWNPIALARQAAGEGSGRTDKEMIQDVERTLRDAVRLRMISDRPIGAFLSGGIDSSTVAALMQSVSNKPIMTFCIGYEEPQYDESSYAKRVGFHLGTDHHELIISSNDALSLIPRLPEIYDEPFADASQIPTVLLAMLVKKHVCVALSGDGGDEVFGGYVRHHWTERVEKFNRLCFGIFGRILRGGIESIPPKKWDDIYPTLKRIIPFLPQMRAPGHYAHKFASLLGSRDAMEMYARLTQLWEADVLSSPTNLSSIAQTDEFRAWHASSTEKMMLLDLLTYLPDDIMVKVDRASMSQSLEVRSPFLDYRIVEQSWGYNIDRRISFHEPKHILRAIAQKYVPAGIFDRPKAGFGIPIDSWLRGPLREWAQSLLSADSLGESGIFCVDRIHQKWSEHLTGRRNWQYHIWNILMFEAWRRTDFRKLYGMKDRSSSVSIN